VNDKISVHRQVWVRMKKLKKGGFYWKRNVFQSEIFLSLTRNSIKILNVLFDARIRENQSQVKDKKGNRRKPHLKKVYGIK